MPHPPPPPALQDLASVSPSLARGLRALLDHRPAEEVEAAFSATFAVEYECYGETRTHELVPGGEGGYCTTPVQLGYYTGKKALQQR